MRLSRIAFLLLLPLFIIAPSTFAQDLSAKARAYLNMKYPGWKQTAVAIDCSSDFSRSVVGGDFDGDRKRDYAVKFVRGNKGYIVALLERGSTYQGHVLQSSSSREIKNTGLSISRKGEQYPVGGDLPDLIYGRLPNDAPMIGPCASHADHFVFRNGRFR